MKCILVNVSSSSVRAVAFCRWMDHRSLVQVLEELLVALDGLLVLLDLLVVELSLVDLVVLKAIQLLPLLQRNEQ